MSRRDGGGLPTAWFRLKTVPQAAAIRHAVSGFLSGVDKSIDMARIPPTLAL